jgi:hypothetical protein
MYIWKETTHIVVLQKTLENMLSAEVSNEWYMMPDYLQAGTAYTLILSFTSLL